MVEVLCCNLALMLAGIVVTLSVVTIPMIIERHVDVGTAMRMSARVTARDLAGHQGIHITTPQTPGRLALMGMWVCRFGGTGSRPRGNTRLIQRSLHGGLRQGFLEFYRVAATTLPLRPIGAGPA